MNSGGKTGAQFAVVILKSLEGGQIDDFANKLFKKWGVGEKGKNNGILLLVAIEDRKARVEVGYGLEPILPDALAGRVLDEQLFPAFKQQRYAEGLNQAVSRIAEIVERGEPASPQAETGQASRGSVLMTLFLSTFRGHRIRRRWGRRWQDEQSCLVIWGLFFGGVPLCMAWMGAGLGFSHCFPLGRGHVRRRLDDGPELRFDQRTRRTPLGTGPPAGPGAASGFGGGGFGGGGFGGGGGGFGGGCSGGGGASGGW